MKIRNQQSRARKQAVHPDQSCAREQAESVVARKQAVPGLPAPPTGPRAYFITFSCYGAWMHGDTAGSVDREHNVFATPVVKPNPFRESSERSRMGQPSYELDAARRNQVLQAIHEVCIHRGWWLFAAHVRATHVHVIVQAGDPPEKVMNDFKVYASRRLGATGPAESERKCWARHGSTRYLWKQEDLEGAIRYVLHEQGEPMATFAGPRVTSQSSREQSRKEQSRDREGAVPSHPEQSRAREQAESVGVREQANPAGVERGRDEGRSLTVAARLAAREQAAFTMMEIAISLAIIGIALVAIIGVLPIGMNAQQENRQETIIGQDSSVFMEAIRNGSLGSDDLTNYVYLITNSWTQYGPIGANGQNPIIAQGGIGYTYAGFSQTGNPYPTAVSLEPLTNGANIIGLMSTPEYVGAGTPPDLAGDAPGQPIPSLYFGGISNHVVAYAYSISGSAVEKPPQDNSLLVQDSFQYRIYCVNTPMAIFTNEFFANFGPWVAGTTYQAGNEVFYNWTYWNSLVGPQQGNPPTNQSAFWVMQADCPLEMALNEHDLRLTFEWPQLPNGNLGSGRQTFRTLVAGQLMHEPPANPANNAIAWNPNLYVYQSQSFTNTP